MWDFVVVVTICRQRFLTKDVNFDLFLKRNNMDSESCSEWFLACYSDVRLFWVVARCLFTGLS